ncbi:hypothetical protein [Limnobacter sp.]|uniref:hypothetical protein n=1 Tax=Limnobacter sp. TaxID=2003368 RepID=UPI00258FC156|nr:hypothetical protein [Limnobacter sp.]
MILAWGMRIIREASPESADLWVYCKSNLAAASVANNARLPLPRTAIPESLPDLTNQAAFGNCQHRDSAIIFAERGERS